MSTACPIAQLIKAGGVHPFSEGINNLLLLLFALLLHRSHHPNRHLLAGKEPFAYGKEACVKPLGSTAAHTCQTSNARDCTQEPSTYTMPESNLRHHR